MTCRTRPFILGRHRDKGPAWRAWLLALGLVALPAAAGFRTVERAYELDPGQLRLPTNVPGKVGVVPCASCPQVELRVSNQTLWHLNVTASPVTLAEFRSAWSRLASAGRRAPLVFVYYRQDNREVTRVVVSPASAAASPPVPRPPTRSTARPTVGQGSRP
jgi:hypothetical protein